MLSPPPGPYRAIVANPPYLRHHRLPGEVKARLREIASGTVGRTLDGRAGLHVYFLLRALTLLARGGRLAFIMPADTCEGIFASTLWEWIAGRFRLDAVITFDPDATPFPRVDTNPVIFLIAAEPPASHLLWARCRPGGAEALGRWVSSGFREPDPDRLEARRRDFEEALATGLSRPPGRRNPDDLTLGDCASVRRGIATGANDFFFVTRERARSLDLPDEFLIPAVGRTRDVPRDEIAPEGLDALDRKGRPTLLFAPDERELDRFPASVRRYLATGEAEGLPRRSLIATRNPWYKMERRAPPPLLFAYLGRRKARFIRNLARVVPLSNFSCVYPHDRDSDAVAGLWRSLQHPETLANLRFVGKSYGSGAIKVEPRSLERLAIPARIAAAAGLKSRRRPLFPAA